MSADERLGMNEGVTRRDFLGGALLASGDALKGGAAPAEWLGAGWDGYGGVGEYRGSNGNTTEVMAAAHALRDGAYPALAGDAVETGEIYDLVVVGGGLSGLAAALAFAGSGRRSCLVLDNHRIFGGEAKQNEFLVDGQRLVAHQGSAVFWAPRAGGLTDRYYERMGMDRRAFDYQTWQSRAREIPLSQSPYDMVGAQGATYGFFFGARFGQRPGMWLIDPWGKKLEGAPISPQARAELLRLRHPEARPAAFQAPRQEGDAISRRLDTITLEDHIVETTGVGRDTIRTYLSPVEGGGYGLGADALSAYCRYAPGLQHPGDGDEHGDQMFPGGNTGFARLMVKALIPTAISGPPGVEGVSRGRVDFRALDRPGQQTRIRLQATAVAVEHEGQPERSSGVTVAYVRGGRVEKVRARSVVMAGGSWSTRHVVRDLPASHREAYARFFRSPCLMANLAVRNWRFLYDMGISGCRWFEGVGNYLEVRKVATIGGAAATIGPDSPTVLTLKVLYSYPGEPVEVQGARGRIEMMGTSFRSYERRIREQLTDMFARSGFDPRRHVAGLVLNRWGHAYVNPQPGFFFGSNGKPAPRDVLRRAPFGRIAFANTDLSGAMDHRNCFVESDRAVKQLLGHVFGATTG
jgi:spermidine dehydrogenase